MAIRNCAYIGVAMLLSACGGSSTGTVPLSSILNEADAFLSEGGLLDDDFEELEPDVALAIGSASYSGFAFVAQLDGTGGEEFSFIAVANTDIAVDFADGQMTGELNSFYELQETPAASGFADIDGTAIQGSMSFELSQADPDDFFFEGTLQGDVTPLAGERLAIDAVAAGGIVGASAEVLALEAFDEDQGVGVSIIGERD